MLKSLGESITLTFLTPSSKHILVNQIRGRRRTLTPAPWLPPKYDTTAELLDPENQNSLNELFNISKSEPIFKSGKTIPSFKEDDNKIKEWTLGSKRVGLLGVKIGMLPQWLDDGTRVLCTMFHIQDNHVISTVSPEDWFKNYISGKRKAFNRFGPMWNVTVGAINVDPRKYSSQYRRLFDSVAVPCKSKLGSFMVTENAIVSPGTKLDVRHFNVGQYITATGKTIDWGFQGGMHRWGMRGLPALRTTKSHRRIGAVGSVGDAKIWPGKRMPGHMGYEWRTVSGLQVLRINAEEQVMYVKGSVPGEVGDVLLIKDCLQPSKRPSEVPFPTFVENDGEEKKECLVLGDNDIYYEKVFKMKEPSIVFTEEHEVKVSTRDRSKAKIAKVKK